ncbi:RNA polymerase sigma-70 factor (ECF subfamily) [Catenulispora sp. MAP12-49]|uniref:sigma-70 family RNA polymerase sigma factor n=1 Tax=unclassified Catenulispora TaxID=414885 RepID=UPI003519D33B
MADSRSTDFGVFYAATVNRVAGYLYVVLGDRAEAEDAAHEAYARAWQRWSKVRDYDDPEAWVRTVAYRVAVNSWRKAKNRLVAHRRSESVGRRDHADPSGLSSDRLVLVEALRKIPREQRQALVLFYVQGLSIAEIAHETGAPPNTVKARLARGRKAVAPYVSELSDDADADAERAATTPSAKSAGAKSGKEVISNA